MVQALFRDDRYNLLPYTLGKVEEGTAAWWDLPDGESCLNILRPDIFYDVLSRELNGKKAVIVDCTSRSQLENAKLFAVELGCPTLMLGTGGYGQEANESGLKELAERIPDLSIARCANSATPISFFMNSMGLGGGAFPGSLKGCHVVIQESHQSKKTTTASTALRLKAAFEAAGATVEVFSIRDRGVQTKSWRVPRKYLDGHAIHRIEIRKGRQLKLQFETRVYGRKPYAEGTRDVVLPNFIEAYLSGNRGLVDV